MNSDKEFEAEVRNKLTLPLTVLNRFVEGEDIPQSDICLAISELQAILLLIGKGKEG